MTLIDATRPTRVLTERGGMAMRRRVLLLVGEDGPHRFEGARVRIGSHPDNELVLSDDTVSRLHAQIDVEEDGVRLRDHNSRNGTMVNGVRVRDAFLPLRAELRLGRARLTYRLLDDEVGVSLTARDRLGELVGGSAPMRELFATLLRLAQSDATALVLGESGTGKEGAARAIHDHGTRAQRAFVVFDCAAVSANLLESELFGHEKGAFTGASGARTGAAVDADGGTLFLDEIGELPLALQPKLLRLLQRGEVQPLGSGRRRTVDVRVIAATHRDLAAEVGRGTFREDLYYRLAVLEVRIPPLRARREDIPRLVRHFVEQSVEGDPERAQRVLDELSEPTWDRLSRHPWPGNVRELHNAVQRMLVLGSGSIPPVPTERSSVSELEDARAWIDASRPWMPQKRELVAKLEAAYLAAALAATEGNITRAAENAGIERMYFKRLCRKHGVVSSPEHP